MNDLERYLKKVSDRLDMQRIMTDILSNREFAEWVLDLNREDQLFGKGVNSQGKIIGYYSPVTQKISKGKKRAGTPYTLKDTGTFFSTFHIVIESDGFRIEADGSKGKDEDIIDKYGEDILGLTEDSRERFRARLTIEIQEYVKQRVFEI